ncbi:MULTISPECIES: helix-turn-helix domain-containing protein [Streptomyces]|uniref:XRE family transcriptional regulator n=1 Tax=Streptomyces luteosporeus TaxID=173856 RepID=A0ABP6G5P9_9ACTN
MTAVPEAVLAREDVRAALARHDFGTFFALVRKWAGISFMRIADACDMKPERVGKLARGEGRVTSVEKMERIADGLRIPGALVRLAPRPWESAAVPAGPSAVPPGPDMAAVESFRAADRRLGGGHLYGSVLHYLHHSLAPRLFGCEAGHGAGQVFRAAASLTEMAGWMAHDSGRDGRAREHFEQALALATAGADSALGANIMASMSHLALQGGRPREAVSLARAGRTRLDVPVPMLSARLHAMEARALARLGHERAAQQALEAAERELGAAEESAGWLSSFDAAALASERALVLQDLGQLAEAAVSAERAVALRSAERARSRVFGQIALATIRAQQRELEAACETGHRVLNACGPLGSARITQQLAALAAAMAPHRGYVVVADFLAAHADVHRRRTLFMATG